MKDLNFKLWIETDLNDLFGFERDKEQTSMQRQGEGENPIHNFDIDELARLLKDRNLPGKKASIKFVNEIHWGDRAGAIKVEISPTLGLEIAKLGVDLQGNKVWVTKKYFQINRDGYGGFEEKVSDDIFELIKFIDNQPLESPKPQYPELESLVVGMANKFRRVAHDIFIFEGVTKINDTNYIIKLGIRGHGIEAPDQRRVEENLTDISFDPKSGKIRVINTNVESSIGEHKWEIMPSDNDFYFFPSQSRDEIIEAMSVCMKWY